jgi:hypothetical protein
MGCWYIHQRLEENVRDLRDSNEDSFSRKSSGEYVQYDHPDDGIEMDKPLGGVLGHTGVEGIMK